MTSDEVIALVRQKFAKSLIPEAHVSADDTQRIERYFGCSMPIAFTAMRALIGIYRIDGDHMLADEIIAVFEAEKKSNSQWEDDLIPFYGIGNGDYLCLRRSQCPNSAVFFVPHDKPTVSKLHASFAEYLNDPEWFY